MSRRSSARRLVLTTAALAVASVLGTAPAASAAPWDEAGATEWLRSGETTEWLRSGETTEWLRSGGTTEWLR